MDRSQIGYLSPLLVPLDVRAGLSALAAREGRSRNNYLQHLLTRLVADARAKGELPPTASD